MLNAFIALKCPEKKNASIMYKSLSRSYQNRYNGIRCSSVQAGQTSRARAKPFDPRMFFRCFKFLVTFT